MTPADIVQAFAGVRVLVLGDVMLDRFVRGEVSRISPEAPIPVLRATRRDVSLGGAGNVAVNIARLGGQARLLAAIGDDAAGAALREAAARQTNLTADLIQDDGLSTIVKTRFAALGQQLLRVDEEDVSPLPPAAAAALASGLEAALRQCDVLVLSDYAKGVLEEGGARKALALAKAAGRAVIVDPKGRDFSRYAGACVITPNAQEAAAATGIACDDDAGAARAAQAIAAMTGGDVVITRGAAGMTVLARGAAPLHLPTMVREVADVSGAGDTVVAALALALAAGADLPAAARLANMAAGIAVGKSGTAPVEAAELARACRMGEFLAGAAKTASPEDAAAIVRGWKAQGKRVVFTNGCFDLLHPGHVRLLERARAAGDRLVVALNSDASVRRLKGEGRPVQGEAARATVMGSIGVVDLVTVFGEDTPLALIAALAPDVLVKGADYAESAVVGADIVKASGGRVVLVPLEEGHSTSGTIRRSRGDG